MHDFQTINEIVSESVRNSSYYTVAISSCVFILYALITNLVSYFKTKSKNKPLIEMSKAMVEMTENIVKLNTILDKTFKDAERKEISKCKIVIDLAFRTFASRISQQCESIITHNNIEKNKEVYMRLNNALMKGLVSSQEFYENCFKKAHGFSRGMN